MKKRWSIRSFHDGCLLSVCHSSGSPSHSTPPPLSAHTKQTKRKKSNAPYTQLQLACRRYAWSVVLFTRPFAFLFLSNPALKNFLSPSLPLSLPPVAVLALVYPLTALSLLLPTTAAAAAVALTFSWIAVYIGFQLIHFLDVCVCVCMALLS